MDEDIVTLNRRFAQALSEIPGFWEKDKAASDATWSFGEEGASLYLDCLAPGLHGQIMYQGRFEGYLRRDIAAVDDFLSLTEIDLQEVDYPRFCAVTIPSLIEIFTPYRGAIETDQDVATADWHVTCEQSQRTHRNIDGRDSVYRIWPVCFFDEELCRRSFNLTAKEVVNRAGPECEDAYMLAGGAFLLVSSQPLVGAEALDALDERVKARLG
jgi:hypothetical protein